MEKILVDIREESEQIRRIFENKDFVSLETILATIEDQDDDISRLDIKYKELENKIHEEYEPKKINHYAEIGINEREFH